MAQLWAWKFGRTAINAMVNFVNLAWMLQILSFKSVGCEQVIKSQIPIRSATNCIEDTSGPEVARQSGEVRQVDTIITSLKERIEALEEEVNRLRSTTDASSTSAGPTYKLRFVEPIAKRGYLGHRITSIGDKAVGVELVDPTKGNQRVTDGELSSLPVVMVPLKSGFNKSVKWDSCYFSASILSSAENHIPLLQGVVNAVLCRGYAEIPGAKFSNSPGLNDKYVRIGVQIDPSCQVGPTILEAVSDELRLLCSRSKANQKPDAPVPEDPVWKIRGIGKKGPFHRALEAQKIFTVKDFFRMLITHPDKLREIANESREKKEMRSGDWDTITLHAKECTPNPNEFYIYHCDSLGSSLLLNSFYQFVEALVKGQHILSQDQLDPPLNEWIDQLKSQAYRDVNNLALIRRCEWQSIVSKSPTFEDSPRISSPPQMNQDPWEPLQDPMDVYPVQGLHQVDQGQADGLMRIIDPSIWKGADQVSEGFIHQPELPAPAVGTNEPSEQICSMYWCPQSPGTLAETEMLSEYFSESWPSN